MELDGQQATNMQKGFTEVEKINNRRLRAKIKEKWRNNS